MTALDRAYVSGTERGIAKPRIDVLERIAAVLRVELVELFARPGPDAEPPRPLREWPTRQDAKHDRQASFRKCSNRKARRSLDPDDPPRASVI